jgi:hypothetical protein
MKAVKTVPGSADTTMVVLCASDGGAPPLHRTNFRNSPSLRLTGAEARVWRGALATDSLRDRGNGTAPAVTGKLNRLLQEAPAIIAAMPRGRKFSYLQAAGTPLPWRVTHHRCPGARGTSASNAWAARASIPATTTAASSSKKNNSANLVGSTGRRMEVVRGASGTEFLLFFS